MASDAQQRIDRLRAAMRSEGFTVKHPVRCDHFYELLEIIKQQAVEIEELKAKIEQEKP